MKKLALVALLSLLSSAPCWAFGLTVLGGFNSYGVSADPAPDSISTQYKPAFGLLAHVGVFPMFSIESGALYMGRGLETVSGDVTTESSYNALVVPVMLKFTGLPFFNVGAGLYYGRALGDIGATITDAATDKVVERDSTFDESGLGTTDYGYALNGQLAVPILPLFKGVVDLRYQQSLTDQSTDSKQEWKGHDLSLMAGLQFDL